MSKPQAERLIQNAILRYLWSIGVYAWTNKSQGTFDPRKKRFLKLSNFKKGVSDILGILPGGRFLAIEVKSAKGKLSDHQKEFIDDINERGGLAFMARSVEDVEFLKDIQNRMEEI